MRRFKTIMFAIFSTALVALFGFEVLAAVYLNISTQGSIEYYATEIGASIWGTYSYDPGGITGNASYLTFSGGGGTSTDNVYELSGEESSYGDIVANVGLTTFASVSDTLTFHIFLKNTGDRYILPSASVTYTDTTYIASSVATSYFDVSEGHVDPLTAKSTTSNATAFVAAVETEIAAERCSAFTSNSSIDNNDTWCYKVTLSLQNIDPSLQGDFHVQSAFQINISFMADVQYTSNNILSIYQVQNQVSPAWVKFGYNATLSANATKVETNSLQNLYTYLDDADEYGNAHITYGTDDYVNAVVYRDIDLVNVDIATGEIIGKLSDLSYDFEWYGRDITLPAGTTLASGRTLSSSETFTVDVYTYYPTMYIRRWVVGNNQWISLSDNTFPGAVEIPGYYTATFEATPFNPDKTAAHNAYGVIPRSYVYDIAVLTNGRANYMINNYGYESYSGITNYLTQSTMVNFATNLTKAWQSSPLYNSGYTCASHAQGKNYTALIYNLLYLVKYANSNTQETIGYGNTSTYGLYNSSGTTVTTSNGNVITTGGNSTNSYCESEKGGGTIGVVNTERKGTATYNSNYRLSANGYDAAGMNYGYNSTYVYTNPTYSGGYAGDKEGLYTNQFLTYNTGAKRYLLDGYVGNDKYTSVFCLGQCNPWGNVWEWIFGCAVISDGTDLHIYISFNNYDYQSPNTTWLMTTNQNGYESNKALLEGHGYIELGYVLPNSASIYRYLGTSNKIINGGLDTLIGFPTKQSSTTNANNGLSDSYGCNNVTTSIFGVICSGNSASYSDAGLFCAHLHGALNYAAVNQGFRIMIS